VYVCIFVSEIRELNKDYRIMTKLLFLHTSGVFPTKFIQG